MAKDRAGDDRKAGQSDAFEVTGDPAHLGATQETQRRVYALPTEMVERIVEFQKEKGLPSEVEAVRRLLDEALQHRDDIEKIINRYLNKLRVVKIGSEAAKDVLVGHPLIDQIKFSRNEITFEMVDGWTVSIKDDGDVSVWDKERTKWYWHTGYSKTVSMGSLNKDELPF